MRKNKTGKYLKYAIGEIVLVVIGILIALQINNWNQNRVNAKKEHDALIGLKQDLENQIQGFKTREDFYSTIKYKGEEILANYSQKGSLLAIDSINSKLSFMMYTLRYPEVTTTFNELNTTGQLNLIRKDSLRSKIIRYYQNSDSANESVNGNITSVFYGQIFQIIKSSVIINFENFNYTSNNVDDVLLNNNLIATFKNNLAQKNREFEIINAISLRVIVADTNKGSINNVLRQASLLLKDIELELN